MVNINMCKPLIKYYKTYQEIIDCIWCEHGEGKLFGIPEKRSWNSDTTPDIADIHYWEEVYQESGNIGIFVAHDPFVELYLIVYYPLLTTSIGGIEKLYKLDDLLSVTDRLGLNLRTTLTPT